ncbi:LysR family transcriptional regulator [Streptosporangium carneum]|uniref:LysR family transcriptional regulator n=1 Tax=Streptosporangium carneum TaxID=47481 RepID=A0A9W6I817_9ACTN|nr:LysR family transcriptional regulator [Streptosporangium carneum]GLK12665.1 LysR family transcriptional regulator [Streptosporangium carneum]
MELRQLRTFEAVVRHGTVTEAANALDLAPSTVSEQIRLLEASLGVALFDRTSKGMRLTGAGERMRGWARRLLDQAEQARLEVAGRLRVLRLGALETIVATRVPRILARLAERRPDVGVEVLAATSRDELLADVIAGRLEAVLLLDAGDALGGLGFPVPATPLTFVDVDPVPLVLVAAPGHRLRGRLSLGAEDLVHERLLVNVPGCSFRMAADRLLGPGPVQVQVGGVAVMRAWAEQGVGVSLLPEFAVSAALGSGALVRLDFAVPDLSMRLVWRADREDLPGLREVLYAASA